MRSLRKATLVLASILPSGAAFADAIDPEGSSSLAWTPDSLISLALAVAAIWQFLGMLRLRGRLGGHRVVGLSRIAAFTGGMATLVLALLSPVDRIGAELFSMHMVQHLLLILVAAPLLVWSRPALVFMWALPSLGRKRLGRVWMLLGLGRSVHWLMHPVVVWILSCGVFAFWHLPRPYQWAFNHEIVHALEHLSFFLTALMFWSIVIAPFGWRRLGYGATLVFIVTTAVLSGLPGALLILSPRPFYPVHAQGTAAWGMTLLRDQQLAGLVMWIPAGFIYVGAAIWVFAAWLREAEARASTGLGKTALLGLLLLAMPVTLSGCGDDGGAQTSPVAGGDSGHGAALIGQYGCGACHVIPGIEAARGMVGPPLTDFSRRIYAAGMLRNTPENLIAWIRDPQRIVPGNVMPAMGISVEDARDIAAYLYTIR
ncbi:MAG: putative rane protein [Rhodospirillaceae bacterium]|nr:putative rane protein [Rhodospirillaceae bacterium]